MSLWSSWLKTRIKCLHSDERRIIENGGKEWENEIEREKENVDSWKWNKLDELNASFWHRFFYSHTASFIIDLGHEYIIFIFYQNIYLCLFFLFIFHCCLYNTWNVYLGYSCVMKKKMNDYGEISKMPLLFYIIRLRGRFFFLILIFFFSHLIFVCVFVHSTSLLHPLDNPSFNPLLVSFYHDRTWCSRVSTVSRTNTHESIQPRHPTSLGSC